ncbi:MAG: hypothetical protein U9N72_10955 [Bacteroidota bacterium]|nr:hypothetical protein [Bacteroidota bacterium]
MRFVVFIALMVFLSPAAASQEKSINVITQPSWPPGSYVPVRIEIRNAGMNDFARFYQDLPQGFSIKSGNTAGADFYWDNNQVNFIWLKLPEDEIIRISYLAMADESLAGSFRLGGRLDYVIEGKERKSVEFSPVIISLDQDANVEEDLEEFYREEIHDDNVISPDRVIIEKPQEIKFRIQVAIASEQITKSELEKRIRCGLKDDIIILRTGNIYKYQSGSFTTYPEASVYLDELKGQGLNDAFIVAYRGDEQISVELARTLTE